MARFLRRGWQWILVGILAVALGVAAYASPGLERVDVHLDEGIVYAVKRDRGLAGMVNTQIEEVAAATTVGDTESTILQHEDLVLVHGEESNTLTRYNPSRNRLESPMTLPTGADVRLIGPQLVVTSRQNGRVWFGDADDVLTMDLAKDKAQFEVGNNGLATLTARGDIVGLDVEASEIVREVEGKRATTKLPFELDAQRAANVDLSAVGDLAVVLDRSSARIWVEGMNQPFDVSGASNAELLPPADKVLGGKEDVRAVYATEAGLIGVTPDGPRSLTGQLGAVPVQPVQLGECLHGAFGNQHVKRCADADPVVTEIPGLDAGATEALSFQINRRTVALNDAAGGVVWLVDQGMARIDSWDEFIPDESDQPPPPDAPITNQKAQRSDENRPPVAQDDDLTARSGRATVLDVLDNDSDPDGDVLTIKAPAEIDGASLQVVRGGTGLQITVPPETGKRTLSFQYEISDGELTATANANVTVADPDPAKENKPPYPFELAQPVTVQKGQSFTKRILFDWRDPEGDPLTLVEASMPPGSEDLVTFTPDGTINYQDVGKSGGTKKIQLKVSDGTATADGELLVNVLDEPVPPVAHGDFATTLVDQAITIEPLENDLGENLTLQEVAAEDCSSCTVVPDYNENRFTFEAPQVGTYYLTYNVSNGPIDQGVVRVDVVAPGSDSAPVAALDVALLPPEGSVFIDPLLNDTDRDGDVLVIQSFTADPSLDVRLERRHLMTISAHSTPDAPVTIEYVVSDGRHTARGTVVVIPTQTTGSVMPTAADDQLHVRAGTTATANVLDNDTSPIGLDLKLNRILESSLADDAWIDGDRLRVRMPGGTRRAQMSVVYEVIDSDGNTASATLEITAISEDAANQPPAPGEVVDRVLAGSTTRIPVRLDGIDPNGDPVRLVGLGSGPKLGRVTEVGEGFLTYEAFPSSEGTDTFRYEVVDALGEKAHGQVRIGVAPPGKTNLPPVAVHDEIVVAPGRPIQIPALANDYDLEGESFGFAESNPVTLDDPTIGTEIVNDREIAIDAIKEPDVHTGTYRIVDTSMQEGVGSFSVTVKEDAPALPPVARDDVLDVQDVIDKDFVEVDVLSNDFDPDGPHEALKVDVPGANPDDERSPRAVEGRKISVPVGERMQQVRYRLTDGDGKTSFGVAVVPGTEDAMPMVRDRSRVVEATAGQPLHISFEDLLVGTQGRKVKLTSTDTVVPTNGTAVPATGGIEYTPRIDYRGPAAVVFEVIDIVPEGDRTAKRGFVTINVDVRAAAHQREGGSQHESSQLPPNQVREAHLQVGPDEGEFRLALMPLFQDPKGLDFNFRDLKEVSGDAPITWRTEAGSSVIVATAPLDAKRGTRKVLSGTVENAQSASAPFEVVLEMVASRQPLTDAKTDVVEEAFAGTPVQVPVLANDVSYLKDKNLKVTGARMISGGGKIDHDGQSVTITPPDGFVGTLTASYSVMDATGDPGRTVDGTIRMNVTAQPGRPSTPFGGVPGDGQIRFEYRSGPNNGHEIIRREVRATAPGHGTVTQECEGNTCTITGLRNGVPWTLSVVEHNKVGASEPSPESAPYTPDVTPLPPGKPEAERGDRELSFTWSPATFENPGNAGSPVEQYTLNLYGSDGAKVGSTTVSGSTHQHTWKGLTNGTNYTLGVVATNRAGSSGESTRSAALNPVGPPTGDAAVTARPTTSDNGGSFTVSVAQGSLSANGDPDMKLYVVPVVDGRERGDERREISYPPSPGNEIAFSGYGTKPVKFQVIAENLHSSRVAGDSGNPIVSWPEPTLTVDSSQGHPDSPGKLRFKVSSNLSNDELGRAGAVTEYSINGGPWQELHRNTNSGYLETGTLPVGVEVEAQVRIRLTNTDNALVATSSRMTLMPVSAQPLQVPKPELSAYDPTHVAARYPSNVSARDSGGWTDGGYRFTSGGETDDTTVLLTQGQSVVEQGWQGKRPGDGQRYDERAIHRDTYDIARPVSQFEMRVDNTVTVTVNWAWEGSECTVATGKGGNRQVHKTLTPDASGRIHMAEKIPVDPAAEDVEYHSSVQVSCRINGRTQGWSKTLEIQ